jgi:hypothetical protein
MSQTRTEERKSALDDFAAKAGMSQGELVPAPTPSMPATYDIPHGALDIRKPRNEAQVRAKLKQWAAMAGDSWFYRWQVKDRKKGTTSWVEGCSIKGANAVLMAYGNARAYPARVLDTGQHWIITAVFVDWESGTEMGRDFRQRKNAVTMGDDRDRQEDMAFQTGQSKAIRNIIVNCLEPYTDYAVEEAKNALVDKIGKNLDRWRDDLVERVSARVELARVEAVVGRKARQWLAPDVARIIAMMSAVADGWATLDETFPPLREEERAVDKFAQSTSVNPSTMNAEAEGAGADDVSPPAHAAPAPASRQEAIDKVLRAATDRDVEQDDRLANLDGLQAIWEERMPDDPGFVRELFKRATMVAKGEIKAADVRRFLDKAL